jgi:hypothetical protein
MELQGYQAKAVLQGQTVKVEMMVLVELQV